MSIQGLGAVRAYQQAARLPQASPAEGGFGAMVEGLVTDTGAEILTLP